MILRLLSSTNKLTKKELASIKRELQSGERFEYRLYRLKGKGSITYNFSGSYFTEFTFRLDSDCVRVLKVALMNRHQGTFTKLFNELVAVSKRIGYSRIVIDCVVSEEMVAWCKKNGFKPCGNNIQKGCCVLGDYSKEV